MHEFDGVLEDMAYALYIKGYPIAWIDAESFLMTGEYDDYEISIVPSGTNICMCCIITRETHIFNSIARALSFLLGKEKGE